MKELRNLRMSEIARTWKVDLKHLGNRGARPDRHHADPIPEQDRLSDIMGYENPRPARSFTDCKQHRRHPASGDGIKRAERLVHEQNFRLDRECPRDLQSLTHAAGKL